VATAFQIHAVLFDAAGTLIELREPAGATYASAAEAHGVRIAAWRLEDALKRILAQASPMVFPSASAAETPTLERAWWRDVVRSTFLAADSSARFSDFDAFFDDLFGAFSDAAAWRCRNGCHEALSVLRGRGIATAVVSNFDARLPHLLTALGITPQLDAVVLPSEAKVAKPDAGIFMLALARLGVPASRSVFVGDSAVRDLAAARALGMRAIDVVGLATLAEIPAQLASLAAGE
jgi:putative hydrolase of the HAD superfamily